MSDPIEVKPDPPVVEAPAKKQPLKVRLKKLYEEYGWVALCTYLGFTAISIATFAIIIGLGFGAESSSGFIGTLIAAWLAAKVTVPLRILGTLALTPLIGRLIARRRKARGEDDDDDDDEDLEEAY